MPNKISTLARKWGCDVSTIRRWRLDGAPVDAPDWRDMAAWLHTRDRIGRGTRRALDAFRRAERLSSTPPGVANPFTGHPSPATGTLDPPANAPVTPEAAAEAHAQRLAQNAAELSDALAGGSPALKPVFDTWQATLGAIFWYYMAQTSDETYERAQELAKEQQNFHQASGKDLPQLGIESTNYQLPKPNNLTPATPARVPTVNQKPDDKYKAK